MKVLLLLGDHSGCGFYRMKEPARVINALNLGVEVEVVDYIDIETNQFGTPLEVFVEADIVVFQRPMTDSLLTCMKIIQKKGIKVVVELDDDIAALMPGHAGYHHVAPHLSPESNWKNLKTACLMADWMTVSTPALTKYRPDGRVSVIRNRVPRSLTELPYKGEYEIGWTGTLETHPDDLWDVHNKLTDYQFHMVGDSTGLQKALSLKTPPTETGWLDIEDYYKALTTLKVGIAPLKTSTFNTGKSYLKVLEYSAVSVPFVASGSPEYRYFVENYGGLLATKSKEWSSRVAKLVNNPDFAREMGEDLRQQVIKHHLMEDGGLEWVSAWQHALGRVKVQS